MEDKIQKELLNLENFVWATRLVFKKSNNKNDLCRDLKTIKIYLVDIEELLKEEGE